MKTKLTLTVDEEIVKKAKDYAEKNAESLSSLIEGFLRNLLLKGKKTSVVDASRGLLKGKYSTMSATEIREEHYKQKYGV